MYKSKTLIAMLIACLMLTSMGSEAFCDGLPEAESEASALQATVTEAGAEGAESGEAGAEGLESEEYGAEGVESEEEGVEQYASIMNVLLPYDISFDIVIVRTSKTGIVLSKEFKIVNAGDNDISVKISSASLLLSDEVNFNVSDSENLPENGNNIYVEMVCSSDGVIKSLPLTNASESFEYTYYLKGGSEGRFWLEGVVNEFGELPWSDASVIVSVCFSMEDEGAVIEPLRKAMDSEAESAFAIEEPSEPESSSESETAEPDNTEELSKPDLSGETSESEPESKPESEPDKEPKAQEQSEAESEPENIPASKAEDGDGE